MMRVDEAGRIKIAEKSQKEKNRRTFPSALQLRTEFECAKKRVKCTGSGPLDETTRTVSVRTRSVLCNR